MPLRRHQRWLDDLYATLNRARYISPDPLELLADYGDPRDREVAGLIASSLAYGRVAQILKSARVVLSALGPRPAQMLSAASPAALRRHFATFRHRFCDGGHLAGLLTAIRAAIRDFGGLQECFAQGLSPGDETVLPAMAGFVRRLKDRAGGDCGHLLPDPSAGSACKRLNLYLRWMVRQDAVDRGHWQDVGPRRLIIPLDTHMKRLCSRLGATRRAASDLKTALEITAAFRTISPGDPVRYDFALTRLGISPAASAAAVEYMSLL